MGVAGMGGARSGANSVLCVLQQLMTSVVSAISGSKMAISMVQY